MIKEILSKADPFFRVSTGSFGPGGSSKCGYDSLPLSRAMLDPGKAMFWLVVCSPSYSHSTGATTGSYLRLRDCVINQIEGSTSPELAEARALVHRIWSRDLYKCVSDKIMQCDDMSCHRRIFWEMTTKEIAEAICCVKGELNQKTNFRITPEHIIVDKCQLHHGQRDKDPVSCMHFLRKVDMNQLTTSDCNDLPFADGVSQAEYESFLPRKLMQCKLRIFCRDSSEDICNLLAHQFEQVRVASYPGRQIDSPNRESSGLRTLALNWI